MLFQLHIPKTGGTTLFAVLAEAVTPGLSHVALSDQELRDRTTGYALLGGHFSWDKLAMFSEPPRVVTVLRDPVERALSLYGYWRARAQEGVFAADAQAGADEALAHPFDELVLDPSSQIRTTFALMTNYLAGSDEVSAGRGAEAALHHLESCAWVGTTETLERDIRILPAALGLLPINNVARLLENADRPKREDVGKEALRVLEELTAQDRRLYDRAVAIADKQQERFA